MLFRSAISPGAQEICDSSNVDEDCDGLADDNDSSVLSSTKTTWYKDGDGDGYGLSTSTLSKCDQPSGYVSNSTDCNDSKSAINPGATEICDGGDTVDTDENCNGKADDGDSTVSVASYNTFYFDSDADGYGDATIVDKQCNTPVEIGRAHV